MDLYVYTRRDGNQGGRQTSPKIYIHTSIEICTLYQWITRRKPNKTTQSSIITFIETKSCGKSCTVSSYPNDNHIIQVYNKTRTGRINPGLRWVWAPLERSPSVTRDGWSTSKLSSSPLLSQPGASCCISRIRLLSIPGEVTIKTSCLSVWFQIHSRCLQLSSYVRFQLHRREEAGRWDRERVMVTNTSLIHFPNVQCSAVVYNVHIDTHGCTGGCWLSTALLV